MGEKLASELKACRWCGYDAYVLDFLTHWSAVCRGCQASGPHGATEGAATAAWNRREPERVCSSCKHTKPLKYNVDGTCQKLAEVLGINSPALAPSDFGCTLHEPREKTDAD